MVSIVIPVYNVEKYLTECVNSVLKMRSEFEMILVDDGSTDGSGILCDKLAEKDDRIRVIHQENGGLSAARNTGISNSKGEYILFLDSDDFVDAEATDELLSGVDGDTEVHMGLYRNYYADRDEFICENSPAFLKMAGVLSAEQFMNAIPRDGQSCYMIAWRFVVQKRFVEENELYFIPGIYHEDEEWTQRLLCTADHIYVSHIYFYQYRQARADAITAVVKPKHVWDTLWILEHALQKREKYEENSYQYSYLSDRAAQLYLAVMLKSKVMPAEDRQKVMERLASMTRQVMPFFCGRAGFAARWAIRVLGVPRACVAMQKIQQLC